MHILYVYYLGKYSIRNCILTEREQSSYFLLLKLLTGLKLIWPPNRGFSSDAVMYLFRYIVSIRV